MRNDSRKSALRSANVFLWKWCLFVIFGLLCPIITAAQRGISEARTPVVEYYEEVIEDRYNLMDINDPIYASLPTADEGDSLISAQQFSIGNNADRKDHISTSSMTVQAPHFKLPQHEMDALYDLYMSTDGPHWRWFSFNASGRHWFFNSSSDPCAQRWQGVLCSQFPSNGYFNVIGMDLNLHLLVGEIPLSIFNLTKLRGINLASNYLVGHFPSEVSKWTELKVLDFSNNIIFGNIPHALCEMPAIQAIYMYNNYFNGTLPACIGNLVGLDVLKFTKNELTGYIPASLSNLVNLDLLYLGRNYFSGTIPPALGNMSTVSSFLLYENALTGHIPDSLVGLTRVTVFNIQKNLLSGTIPPFLANLARCTFLYLNDNHFTGTVSPLFASAPALQNFYMEDNMLTGTIPPELSNISSMLSLELSYNQLHGTIPEALCNLPKLQILFLLNNQLTGTIPEQIGNIKTLQTFAISSNFITGTIPDSVGMLNNVSNFYVYHNNLHGRVPEAMNNMTGMIYMYMDHNMFSGSLPVLSNLPIITSFFIEDNHLTGTLENVFEPSAQRFLTLIQVSNNQLTGTLPDKIFDLPELQTFIAVSNCFQGSLPTSICKRSTLKTLGLDGIRSASSCQKLLLPGLSSSYVLTEEVENGIPPCLFAMPKLNTLHLSGNDLTGTLPHNLNISSTLMDISLSHNKLKGLIPTQLQDQVWYNLDLSFNKFSGTLSKNFGTKGGNFTFTKDFKRTPDNFTAVFFLNQTNLLLRNNRLSYHVPASILDRVNITILQGNLFSCELDNSDLPEHDSGRPTYQCGSNSFNISYYFWLGATAFLIVTVFLIYYWRQRLEPYIADVFTAVVYLKRWLNIVTWYDQENYRSKSKLHYYKYVMLVSEAVLKFSVYTTVFILVVMLPLYSGLSAYFGTHSYEYAWTVSAAFLSGYGSTIAMMLFFFLLIGMLMVQFRYTFRTLRQFLHDLPQDLHFSVLDDFQEEEVIEKNEDHYSSASEKIGIYVAFFLINVVIVMSVNVGYVYVVIYEDSRYIIMSQIALSIFKLGWNNMGSVYLIRWTHHHLASNATKDWKTKGAGFFAIQLFVSLFNYIAIPCLVVGVISPNCFNSIVIGAPSVSSYYYYEACGLVSVHFGCLINQPSVGSTSYNPPFTYSYECSSSLITYYAPTFVYLCIITVFVNPLLEIAMQQAHHRATPGTWWAAQMDYWVPPNLQDLCAEADAHKQYDIFSPFFDANLLLVTIITYLGVLLTFGLVFPPLSIAMLVSIFSVIYCTKLEMGRFLTNAITQNLHKHLDRVEEECFGVGSIPKLRQCVRMLIVFACLFYTPFLFDTLGDSVGLEGAIWVLILVPLLPAMLWTGHLVYIYFSHRGKQGNRENSLVSIEMRKSEFFRSKQAHNMFNNALELESQESQGDADSVRSSMMYSISSMGSRNSMNLRASTASAVVAPSSGSPRIGSIRKRAGTNGSVNGSPTVSGKSISERDPQGSAPVDASAEAGTGEVVTNATSITTVQIESNTFDPATAGHTVVEMAVRNPMNDHHDEEGL